MVAEYLKFGLKLMILFRRVIIIQTQNQTHQSIKMDKENNSGMPLAIGCGLPVETIFKKYPNDKNRLIICNMNFYFH